MIIGQSGKQHRKSGFSLIELAIVMALVGLMIAAFLPLYSVMQQKKAVDLTKGRLADIRTALTLYVITHGNLPCPAGPAGDYDADQCAKGTEPMKGVIRYNIDPPHTPTDGKNDVWTGILPVRELRLDGDQIIDGWGNNFTYAVSRRLTLPNSMRGNPLPLGVISVIDEKGDSVLDKPGTSRYVVVSHGPTGAGAWMPGGARKPCTATTLDGANCSGLNAFVVAPMSKQAGARFYDDIVIHDDQNAGGGLVDRLAVCSAKEGFYEPSNPYADADGCTLSRQRLR